MTNERLSEIRGLAESHAGKASQIILELLEELEKLRRMKLRTGLHPIGAEEPWPYEPYRGVPLAEVPEDHLREWMAKQNRRGLKFDVEYAAVALRDLLLYDYIYKIATPPPPPSEPDPNVVRI